MKTSYTKDELLTMLKGHENNITTARNWNQYSKDNALPHSQTLISHFGSWNALKKELSLVQNDYLQSAIPPIEPEMNDEKKLADLLNILKGHENNITTVSKWNEYSKENELPHSQTIISYFGSWNRFKAEVSNESIDKLKVGRPEKYSDEELYAILDKYKMHYTSATEWDLFAETENLQLPKHMFFMDRLGPTVIREKTGLITTWTTDEIIKVILKYFPRRPPSQAEWMELASRERVPGKMTIIRRFKSWNQMKYEVYYKN